ncbi:MAG: hypothetical protein GY861_08825 [bacterium]|nr:hypothetical protein [bacterium]
MVDKKDAVLLAVLFLVALIVWSAPINDKPFGEGDAAWHFGIGDYISQNDQTFFLLPDHIGYWYYNFTPNIGINGPEYPPTNHVNYATMQVAGGARVESLYIYKAITSFLGVFAVFFLIRRLYGPTAAFLAGFGLIFSFREIHTYMWGQQPTLISLVYVPVVLYTFYSFLDSFYKGEPKNIYLYILVLLLASQFLFHLQGLFVALPMLIFLVVMIIKYKRLPLSLSNLKHIGIALAIFLLLAAPFIQIYSNMGVATIENKKYSPLSRLFSWNIDPDLEGGSYIDEFYLYEYSYPPWYVSVPLILIAVLFLLIKAVVEKRNRELFMLSWIFAVYLILHMDVILGFTIPRVTRMLMLETQLFYALMAISLVSIASFIPSLIKLASAQKKILILALKLILALAFILIVIFTTGAQDKQILDSAYANIGRVTQAQMDAAEWMGENLPEDALLRNYGTGSYAKIRFMYMLSHRFMAEYHDTVFEDQIKQEATHYMFDYSDFNAMGRTDILESLSAVETDLVGNSTPLYNQNGIKVYEIEAE